MYNKVFIDNLKYFLGERGMTQADLANRLGMTKGAISDWMGGRAMPRMAKIQQIAQILDIENSDLVEERNNNNKYFVNKEVQEIAQELYNNPEARTLFRASQKLSKEDMQVVKAMIDSLTKKG